jgi:hypothetical protein|eukprot:XP_020397003.1 cysteine-rich receptor-like protein kinase 6 [Zea mays]
MAHHLMTLAAIVAAVVLLLPCATGYPWAFCGENNNFKANSSYQSHLSLVAATLPKNASTSPDLFATAVVGTIPRQLWAMGLCRGDVDGTACFNCLTQAFRDLPNHCSYNKDATMYYDPCMLHYSNNQLIPDDDSGDFYTINSTAAVNSDPVGFNRLVAALVNATADYAAHKSTRRFATGETTAGSVSEEFPKLYSLAQCTPDMKAARCRECLAALISQSLDAFQNLTLGRVLWINCTYRYEAAPFFNGPAMVQIAVPSSSVPVPAPAPTLAPAIQPSYGTPAAVAGVGESQSTVHISSYLKVPDSGMLGSKF